MTEQKKRLLEGRRMKRYTKADMEKFRHDEFGNLICPAGDYSQIRSFDNRCSFEECCSFGKSCSFGKYCGFGKECSFGEWCSFGERISFGKACSFEDGRVKRGKYFACDRIGSRRRKTYFFRDGDGNMFVRAGCWFSSIDEFVERVKDVHSGTKYEKEYLAAVELAKIVLEG